MLHKTIFNATLFSALQVDLVQHGSLFDFERNNLLPQHVARIFNVALTIVVTFKATETGPLLPQ